MCIIPSLLFQDIEKPKQDKRMDGQHENRIPGLHKHSLQGGIIIRYHLELSSQK